jgi:hypothetical protein
LDTNERLFDSASKEGIVVSLFNIYERRKTALAPMVVPMKTTRRMSRLDELDMANEILSLGTASADRHDRDHEVRVTFVSSR